MIFPVVMFKVSYHQEELLLLGILGVMALIGLVLLYRELRNGARARKCKTELLELPDGKDRLRKAG